MRIKKTYNFQFVILTFCIILSSFFFFTSKLYFPDDREKKKTKPFIIDNNILQVNPVQYDNEMIEILLVNDVSPNEFDLSNIQIYEQKKKTDLVSYAYFHYVEERKEYHYFYIPITQFKTLEDMYYLTMTTSKDTERIYIDYRNIQKVPIIIKKDESYLEKIELRKSLKILQQTRKEIILSLKNPDFDEMQKQALRQQLEHVDLSIRGVQEALE